MSRLVFTQDWDLRKHIVPGDKVKFASMKACDSAATISRRGTIPYEGTAVAVYEKFVMVKLKVVCECANRWDIYEINGVPVNFGR